jgi:hypothetical protein
VGILIQELEKVDAYNPALGIGNKQGTTVKNARA